MYLCIYLCVDLMAGTSPKTPTSGLARLLCLLIVQVIAFNSNWLDELAFDSNSL